MSDAARQSPLLTALARTVRDRRDDEALCSVGERTSLTYGQFAQRVDGWSLLLGRVGIEPGSLVGLATGNTSSLLELFFALRGLGASVLMADESLKASGMLEICRRMGASWILHRNSGLGGAGLAQVPDPSVRLTHLDGGSPPPVGTALVKLTSGSTLNPRGACFTEEALLEGIDHIATGMSLTGRDRVLISIPLSHSYGFDNGILSLAVVGTPLVLQSDVLPAAMLETIREREITFFPAVPALVRALSQVEWPRGLALRSVISASAPLPREAAEAFHAACGIRVQQFYGATESGGISFETRPGDAEAEGSVGFPLPGIRIEIHPEEGVRIHSRANRFAILPGPENVPAHVTTGDRAAWTPEGRLKLLGRIQIVGNIGGVKIDLGAIDAFLRTLPGVVEAAVLPIDDPVKGHRLVACVESDVHSPGSLLELCRERLSAREVPSEIRVLDRLPRTERGKLDRSALSLLISEGAR